ncbi:MAG: DUF1349 domain-containing protein [Erysipelotrichaceae bacterium]|nr:DUF1349 domain-containing protein [Erysipelotrichaceae bacterium]
MTFKDVKWTRIPARYLIQPDRIEITTTPHTDLWQRTYYHFRNDNAPVLQHYIISLPVCHLNDLAILLNSF